MKFHLPLLFFLGAVFFSKGQVSCIDPIALNYSAGSTVSDTSCQYSLTNTITYPKIASLVSSMNEASALVSVNGRLFTLTDSGNNPEIFEMDTISGQVRKKTRITNFPNVDWEELTTDDSTFYIGDFGNNNGDRTNLKVLAVSKAAVLHVDSLNIKARAIRFTYPDQTSFSSSNSNNFDCEAFFFANGKLHLFSKNRGNRKTKYYTLDPSLANQIAEFKGELDVRGLITGSALSPNGKTVALIGLGGNDLTAFVWLLFGFEGNDYLGANRRRIELPNILTSGQAEGICFRSEYQLLLSNEKLSSLPASVRQFSVSSYLLPFFTPAKSNFTKERLIHYNPTEKSITIVGVKGAFVIYGPEGRIRFQGDANEIHTAGWNPGVYYLRESNGESGSSPLKFILY